METLRIATHNVNGIRAAHRRGIADFWSSHSPDVVALQEVRCRIEDLPAGAFGDYAVALDPGSIAGRNGVAILTKQPPVQIRSLSGTAWQGPPNTDLDEVAAVKIPSRGLAGHKTEGRYLEVDLADAPIRVASLYLPKGAAWPYEENSKEKYDRKMAFMAGLAKLITASRREAASLGREYLIMGDFNIAHTERDLKNWRTNKKSEGFLPEERDWFSSILSSRSLVDVVRKLNPDVDGPYSWWSWRGQAFANDAGWRIDYHLASPKLAARATDAFTAREPDYDSRISDHSPVVVDYRLSE